LHVMLSEAKHLVPQLVQRDSSLAPLTQNDEFALVGLRRSFTTPVGSVPTPGRSSPRLERDRGNALCLL